MIVWTPAKFRHARVSATLFTALAYSAAQAKKTVPGPAGAAIPLVVNFGASNTGKAAAPILAKIYDNTDTLVATVNSGWTEIPDAAGTANTGSYYNRIATLDSTMGPYRVSYSITGVVGVGVSETLGFDASAMQAIGYNASRAALLDFLDRQVSLSLAASAYTPPPTTAQIAVAVMSDIFDPIGFVILQMNSRMLTSLPNLPPGGPGGLSLYTAGGVQMTVGGYATGQDPPSLLLLNPANKLSTDSQGRVPTNDPSIA